MEIVKTLNQEPAPFDTVSNYIMTWNIDPSVVDLSNSYINIPMAINETYAAPLGGGTYQGAVGNVSLLGNNDTVNLAECNIRSVRFRLDGSDIIYTVDINRLNASLDVYRYNVSESRLQEYLSGAKQTYPGGLTSTTPLRYSIFRELYNNGTKKSLKFNALLRVPVSKLLGGLADSIRDFTKYQSIELVVELDDVTKFLEPNEVNPTFGYGVTFAGAQNDIQYGTNIAVTAAGGNTVLTSVADFNLVSFPYGVGDTINIDGGINARAITAIAVNGTKVNVTVNGANINAGNYNILGTSVSTFKQFKLTNTTVATVNAIYPANAATSLIAIKDNVHNLTINGTYPIQYIQSVNDVLVVLSLGQPYVLNGNLLTSSPLFFAYNGTPGNNNPIPSFVTVDNYSESTLDLWIGQPVVLQAIDNLTVTSAVISAINYQANANKATIAFSQPILATGGGAILGLCAYTQKAQSLAISYPERIELVQYRLNRNMKLPSPLDTKYRKWVFDADVIQALPANASYEHTFTMEPLVDMVAICICANDSLVSNMDTLVSYRLRLDGLDLTSRELLLTGDDTFKLERLVNGFQYLSDSLDTLTLRQDRNLLSPGQTTYVMLQDLLVDGNAHKLTVSIKNGNANFATRPLRLYKRVISKLD